MLDILVSGLIGFMFGGFVMMIAIAVLMAWREKEEVKLLPDSQALRVLTRILAEADSNHLDFVLIPTETVRNAAEELEAMCPIRTPEKNATIEEDIKDG